MRLFGPGLFELNSLSDKDLHPFGTMIVEFRAEKLIDNSQPLVAKPLTSTQIAQNRTRARGQTRRWDRRMSCAGNAL